MNPHVLALTLTLTPLLSPSLAGQIGGNGQDGDFHPTADTSLQARPTGYDFRSITIPSGVTVTATGTVPLILRSQRTVTIDGTLTADGQPTGTCRQKGAGGPGGWAGGEEGHHGGGPGGGQSGRWGRSGPGPITSGDGGGGGSQTAGGKVPNRFIIDVNGDGGIAYGSAIPFDTRGGSGGGGGGDTPYGNVGGGGAGGGGCIVIHSDSPIRVRGTIAARGGTGWTQATFSCIWQGAGGAGGGGSIYLRSAQTASVSTGARIDATGGHVKLRDFTGGATDFGKFGGDGRIRIDAYGTMPQIQGTVTPAPSAIQLPHLHTTTAPKVGNRWNLVAAADAGDFVLLYLSHRSKTQRFDPFGILHLDPAGLVLIGGVNANTSIDPIASFSIPIPNDARLRGLMFPAQAINAISAAGRPLLTNAQTPTIQ